MEHSYIDEHGLIDRYVRGTLPLDERAAFEEHFLDCGECLDQLEIAKSLRDAIRISAADFAGSPEPAGKPSFANWLRGLFGWRWGAAVITAVLLVVFSPAIILYQLFVSTRNELAQNQLAFVKELQDARKYFENAQQAPPLVYTLEQTRSSSAPARAINIPATPQWIVFSVSMDVSQFPTYRATLTDLSGKVIWHNDKIQPASSDALGISVPSTVFTSELYTLTVEGITPTGAFNTLSRFDLKAVYKR